MSRTCGPGAWLADSAPAGGLSGRTPQPAGREILRLALPAFGALVAEPLFLLADSAIVGRLGTVPLGGLGVASQALTTLVGISIFLAYGTTAAVARQLGRRAPRRGDPAGHRRPVARSGHRRWLVLAAGLAAGPADRRARSAAPPAVSHAGRDLPADQPARRAAMLPCWPAPGVLRGLQDTRTPLLVAVVANAVNIALNATFVLGLHWGIAGSAWGTVDRADRHVRGLPRGRRPRRAAGRRRPAARPAGRHGRPPSPGRRWCCARSRCRRCSC